MGSGVVLSTVTVRVVTEWFYLPSQLQLTTLFADESQIAPQRWPALWQSQPHHECGLPKKSAGRSKAKPRWSYPASGASSAVRNSLAEWWTFWGSTLRRAGFWLPYTYRSKSEPSTLNILLNFILNVLNSFLGFENRVQVSNPVNFLGSKS